MAVLIVHELEAVEVEEDHAELLAVALGALDLVLDRLAQEAGVVDLGHVVDERPLLRAVVALGIRESEIGVGGDQPRRFDLLGLEGTGILEDPEHARLAVSPGDRDREQASRREADLAERIDERAAREHLELAQRVGLDRLAFREQTPQVARLLPR